MLHPTGTQVKCIAHWCARCRNQGRRRESEHGTASPYRSENSVNARIRSICSSVLAGVVYNLCLSLFMVSGGGWIQQGEKRGPSPPPSILDLGTYHGA